MSEDDSGSGIDAASRLRLDVESLRALRAVVARGAFVEAANDLGLTPSAVSWKIKRLEERVGCALLKRGSVYEATPDGRDLLMYAGTIIDAHDAAVDHLRRSDVAGVVRLGCNEDLRGGQLASLLAAFHRMHPQIDLDIRIHMSEVVAEWLDTGDVDIAVLEVLTEDIQPDDVVLVTEPILWVHAADATFDPKKVLPLVTLGPGLNYLAHVEEALARDGRRWRKVVECPMVSGVQSAVEEGLGISALNARNVTTKMVRWTDAGPSKLSTLSEIVRVGDGAPSPAVVTLRNALIAFLKESS